MPATARTTLRRLALGALLTGGVWLSLTALDGAAHADNTTPAAVTESPGGALGDVLNGVGDTLDGVGGTVGAVVEVVDEVVPDPPKSEPEPEPEQADHSTDEQDGEDITPGGEVGEVLDGIGQVVKPVTGIVETVVETVTAPLPIPAPPVTVPALATQPTEPAAADDSTDSAKPATELPERSAADTPAADVSPAVGLPVVGPVAGSATLLPGLTPTPAADHQPDPQGEPRCDGRPTIDHVRDALRMVVSKPQHHTPSRAAPRAPQTPCPQPADTGSQAVTATAGVGHTGHQCEHYADRADGLLWPELDRLHQVRARGDLPAGRCPHLDPGPA
ncbi:hypothetical protein AB0J14_38265 [Micromonospora arborensis]|uniref:hypothetical protein n=1 Tax=Micromonospora arborensis TaxID=2116518 RepID=UPI0033EB3B45